jgi:hypothetical protein
MVGVEGTMLVSNSLQCNVYVFNRDRKSRSQDGTEKVGVSLWDTVGRGGMEPSISIITLWVEELERSLEF